MGAAKAVMAMLGVDVGPARLPNGSLTAEQARALRAGVIVISQGAGASAPGRPSARSAILHGLLQQGGLRFAFGLAGGGTPPLLERIPACC